MKLRTVLALAAGAAAASSAFAAPARHPAHPAGAAPPPSSAAPARPAAGRQSVTGPVASYWMSAATTSGMGGGAGGRPTMAQMMGGGGGRGANFTHSLILQLGSRQHPTAPPQAEHDPPAGLKAGPALPLVTPQSAPPPETYDRPPSEYRQPKGRMLIFWGCGDHAGPGQPFVIDFATLGSAEGANRMAALMRGVAIERQQPPSAATWATYGEWPNDRSRTTVPPEGSLEGAHTVKGDYSPQIDFSLDATQDFLPPFHMTSNAKTPIGSVNLGWRPVDGALGYYATMIGAQGENEVVMWTSSATQAAAFGMPEYLSNGEISRLVNLHTLMPPSQTSCAVPQEAVQAAGQGGFWNLTAFGGEANFSYPPRPPAPQAWNIAWEAKVRYRSATSGILGMDMEAMMRGDNDDEGGGDQHHGQHQQQQQPQPQPKPHNPFGIPGGLGGFIP